MGFADTPGLYCSGDQVQNLVQCWESILPTTFPDPPNILLCCGDESVRKVCIFQGQGPELGPQGPSQAAGLVAQLWGDRQVCSWDLLGSPPRLAGELQANERLPQKPRWRALLWNNIFLWPPRARVCVRTHIHTLFP